MVPLMVSVFFIYITEEEGVRCFQSLPLPYVYSKSFFFFIRFSLLKAQRREVIRQSKGNWQLECRAFFRVRVSERILIKSQESSSEWSSLQSCLLTLGGENCRMREKEKEEKERRRERKVRKGSKSHKEKGEEEKSWSGSRGRRRQAESGWGRDLKQSENQKGGEERKQTNKQTNKQISGKERHQWRWGNRNACIYWFISRTYKWASLAVCPGGRENGGVWKQKALFLM